MKLIFADFRSVTKQDIFLARLRNTGFSFLNIDVEDQLPFFLFCIEHNLLAFERVAHHKGVIAQFWALDDFSCEFRGILVSNNRSRHNIERDDSVEWTWSILNLSKTERMSRANTERGLLNLYTRHYVWNSTHPDEVHLLSEQVAEFAKKHEQHEAV